MSANVENMFYTGEVPWHGIGIEVDDALTSKDALIKAQLNWKVISRDVYVDSKRIDGYVANVRNSDGNVLGIVSDSYKIVQNEEAFAFTDALIDTGEVKYETAGSLNKGRQVWMLARLPETILVNDKTIPYLVFSNCHDGKGSVRVAITPVRVVCQNTLNIALREAERGWSVKHMGNMEYKLEEAKRTLGLARHYMIELNKKAEYLASISVSDALVKEMLEELIAIPDDAGIKKESNVISLRNKFMEKYNEQNVRKFRGTAWGVVNATSDFATHTPPLRMTDTYQERLFEKTIGGNPIVDKMYDLLKLKKVA